MAKRFVETSRYRQAWRKLEPKLRAAFYWLVENCDAAGYWDIDLDHFRFECGYALDVDALIKETGAVERYGDMVIRIIDFIEVNYGELKEGYNPHKPAFRALAKRENLSFIQACPKLEDEDEDEDEVLVSEKKGREPEMEWPKWAGPNVKAKWEEFKAYRHEAHRIKYKSTRTEQHAVNLLAKYYTTGQDCVSALDLAMGKGWKFPVDPSELKANGKPTAPLPSPTLKPWMQ